MLATGLISAIDPHGRLAQLARAPRLHRGCRGFESLIAHYLIWQRNAPSGILWQNRGFCFPRPESLRAQTALCAVPAAVRFCVAILRCFFKHQHPSPLGNTLSQPTGREWTRPSRRAVYRMRSSRAGKSPRITKPSRRQTMSSVGSLNVPDWNTATISPAPSLSLRC
jgi:hypothetical protein